MITLITGTPGAGKTLYTVAELLTKYVAEHRPLFVQGIPDLALDHSVLPAESEWTVHRPIPGNVEGKTAPYYDFPENAVLVIDECQNTFRPRANGSKVPDLVAALETHRHTGIDFVLITQHPSRIDGAVKTLVGRHIHVRRVFGWKRAIVYEWDAATDPARVKLAVKRSWSYPRKAFKLYKSSQLHTARGNRVPFVVWFAAAAVLAVPVGWYYAFDRTAGKWLSEEESDTGAATEPATARTGGAAPLPPPPTVPASILEATTPADPRNPLSAPLYAAIAPPVVAPEIVGCVASRSRCSCYTQQQTPVHLPDDQCRERAAGHYYDPYLQPSRLEASYNAPPTSAGSLLPPEGRAPSASGSSDLAAGPASSV